SESGEGTARNVSSHARSACAAAALKPRRSPAGAGASARTRTANAIGASGRAAERIERDLGRRGSGGRAVGPGGLEPPFPDPKSGVLPLDEGPAPPRSGT